MTNGNKSLSVMSEFLYREEPVVICVSIKNMLAFYTLEVVETVSEVSLEPEYQTTCLFKNNGILEHMGAKFSSTAGGV